MAQQIKKDPNIVAIAQEELNERNKQTELRNEFIQSLIDKDKETYDENVQTGLDQDAATSQETRKQYLESLGYDKQ